MLVAQWDKVHPYPHGSSNHDGVSEEYLNKVGLTLCLYYSLTQFCNLICQSEYVQTRLDNRVNALL